LLYLRCDELHRQLLYKLNKAKWARYISSQAYEQVDRCLNGTEEVEIMPYIK